jgi:hypothetical protein
LRIDGDADGFEEWKKQRCIFLFFRVLYGSLFVDRVADSKVELMWGG